MDTFLSRRVGWWAWFLLLPSTWVVFFRQKSTVKISKKCLQLAWSIFIFDLGRKMCETSSLFTLNFIWNNRKQWTCNSCYFYGRRLYWDALEKNMECRGTRLRPNCAEHFKVVDRYIALKSELPDRWSDGYLSVYRLHRKLKLNHLQLTLTLPWLGCSTRLVVWRSAIIAQPKPVNFCLLYNKNTGNESSQFISLDTLNQ